MQEPKDKICIDWFKGRSQKEKDELEYVLRNNSILRQALLDILTRYEEAETRIEISSAQYDNPSWAYKQADINGAKRALAKIRTLFTF